MDEAFFNMVRNKFAQLDTWKVEKPLLYYRMLMNWEIAKRTFSGKESKVAMPLPKPLKALFTQGSDEEESFFTGSEIKALFDPVVYQICELIEAQLRMKPEISCVFLVGGFSASPYLFGMF